MAYQELAPEEEMPAVFHEWLQWLPLLEDKPANTIRAYSQGVRRILYYSEIEPSSFGPSFLTQATLTDTVRTIRASGTVSKATLNNSLAALKSFYDYCVNDRLIEIVPDVARIRKIAKLEVPQVVPEYYRPLEIRALYQAAAGGDPEGRQRVLWPARDLAMCAFLAVLGLRAHEVADANQSWITKERERREFEPTEKENLWIIQVLGKGRGYDIRPGDGGSAPLQALIRRIPLTQALVEANERWQAERTERFGPTGPDDPLFVARDGARFTYQRLRYWLRTLNRVAGLRDRGLHALRHTAGVQLATEGAPVIHIQALLGHKNLVTTGIYTELAGGVIWEFIEQTGANDALADALDGV